jgi:hypothetical protein
MKYLPLLLLFAPLAFAQPSITTSSLPAGAVGDAYGAQLSCTGCTPSDSTWLAPSGFPPGLNLNVDTGAISGTPTAAGTYSFTVYLSIPGATVTRTLSVVINPHLAVVSTSLPNGTVGDAYSQPLVASGGLTPYQWIGTTPAPGLSIVNGVVQGTPTQLGTFTFSVTVYDAQQTAASSAVTLSITGAALAFAPTPLPPAFKGVPYTQQLSATGGAPPYTWTLAALSDSLTINSSTGVLSGTPAATGQYTLNVTVTDSANTSITRGLTLNVLSPLTVTTTALANASVGVAYSQTLAATGGQTPYTWSIPAASLPPGLTLNASTGAITGTPTAAGTYALTATVTDSAANTASAHLSITVANGVVISPAMLPGGTVGTAYAQVLTAAGGTAPYTWSIVAGAGALPNGLNLNTANGAITGTPSLAGTYGFTVQAADAAGLTGQAHYSVTIASPPLTITTTSLPQGVVGTAYSQVLIATGGTSSYTWSLASGTLPGGLQLIGVTGAITGTPTATGTFPFTIQVTDTNNATAQASLSIVVVSTPLAITTASLPGGTIGLAYSQTVAATGGAPPYTWSATGLSPLSINASTGAITGTPTAAGTLTAVITVKDSSNTTVTKTLSIVIAAPTLPVVTVTGAPATSGFQQQLPITLQIGSAYPTNITGTVTLTFAPSVTPSAGVDDAMIQFSSGGRTINFTIPSGQTAPTLTGASSITVLTGTTAGTITLTTDLKDANGNDLGSTTKTIVTAAGAPFISSVTFQQVTGGVTVTVVGFSSTRDMVSGNFTFAPATNATFSDASVTVPLTSAFTTWWGNTAQSNPYGTQFTLTVPFTTSTQSVSVVSVTVNLTNSKGTSSSVSPAQ